MLTVDDATLELAEIPRVEFWPHVEISRKRGAEIGDKALPDVPGVYCLWRGSTLIYAGMATSIKKRIQSHLNEFKDASKVSFLEIGGPERAIVEQLVICAYAPHYNRDKLHKGRRSQAKVVEEIERIKGFCDYAKKQIAELTKQKYMLDALKERQSEIENQVRTMEVGKGMLLRPNAMQALDMIANDMDSDKTIR